MTEATLAVSFRITVDIRYCTIARMEAVMPVLSVTARVGFFFAPPDMCMLRCVCFARAWPVCTLPLHEVPCMALTVESCLPFASPSS